MSVDERLLRSSEEWRSECHYSGGKPKAYLTLPFKSTDIPSVNGIPMWDITEGWIYSPKEQELYNRLVHGGIDFALPYGTPIVAPCDGWVMSSYHLTIVRNPDRSIKYHEGKPVGYGLGYFLQFYLEDNDQILQSDRILKSNRILQLGHLSNIHPDIPFSPPKLVNENEWNPRNHNLLRHELVNLINDKSVIKKVSEGELVGWLGHSGMTWGYDEYQEGEARPIEIDPVSCPSHDENHVHMEDSERDIDRNKGGQRDLVDAYGTAEDCPTPTRRGNMGPKPLFKIDLRTGLPVFPR